MSNETVTNLENTAKADVAKVETAVKAEVTKVESSVKTELTKLETATYSEKVVVWVAVIAFVAGIIVRSVL